MIKKTFLALAAAAFLFGGSATVAPTPAEATFSKKHHGGERQGIFAKMRHGKVMGWTQRKHHHKRHGAVAGWSKRDGGGWWSNWQNKRAERKAMRAEKRAIRKERRQARMGKLFGSKKA